MMQLKPTRSCRGSYVVGIQLTSIEGIGGSILQAAVNKGAQARGLWPRPEDLSRDDNGDISTALAIHARCKALISKSK